MPGTSGGVSGIAFFRATVPASEDFRNRNCASNSIVPKSGWMDAAKQPTRKSMRPKNNFKKFVSFSTGRT
jgi:hypothetical protein